MPNQVRTYNNGSWIQKTLLILRNSSLINKRNTLGLRSIREKFITRQRPCILPDLSKMRVSRLRYKERPCKRKQNCCKSYRAAMKVAYKFKKALAQATFVRKQQTHVRRRNKCCIRNFVLSLPLARLGFNKLSKTARRIMLTLSKQTKPWRTIRTYQTLARR